MQPQTVWRFLEQLKMELPQDPNHANAARTDLTRLRPHPALARWLVCLSTHVSQSERSPRHPVASFPWKPPSPRDLGRALLLSNRSLSQVSARPSGHLSAVCSPHWQQTRDSKMGARPCLHPVCTSVLPTKASGRHLYLLDAPPPRDLNSAPLAQVLSPLPTLQHLCSPHTKSAAILKHNSPV